MTTGPDGEGRPEPTFADVMNAFSFDSGRKSKRRRWGHRRDRAPEEQPDAVQDVDDQDGGHPDERYGVLEGGGFQGGGLRVGGFQGGGLQGGGLQGGGLQGAEPTGGDSGSTSVRPYAWTRGRTRSGYALEIETLVSTSPRGREQVALLQVEHRAVAELCQQARSVAEVAALLRVPLGVAKVLVGDMAGLGLVAVHQSFSANGNVPDLALMERVLSGLRRL